MQINTRILNFFQVLYFFNSEIFHAIEHETLQKSKNKKQKLQNTNNKNLNGKMFCYL